MKSTRIVSLLSLVIFLILLLSGVGCQTTNHTPIPKKASSLKVRDEKSYVVNKVFTVSVGDTVVSRRKYFYRVLEVPDRVIAAMDFRLRIIPTIGSPLILDVPKGTEFRVLGQTEISKGLYRSVYVGEFPGGLRAAVLIDPLNGVPLRSPVVADYNSNNNFTVSRMKVETNPADAFFETVERTEVETSEPFENYDIIFTGRSGRVASFVYREYSPQDLAKTAFFQDLTYDLSDETTIRFRRLQMEILDLNNAGITLRMISDE